MNTLYCQKVSDNEMCHYQTVFDNKFLRFFATSDCQQLFDNETCSLSKHLLTMKSLHCQKPENLGPRNLGPHSRILRVTHPEKLRFLGESKLVHMWVSCVGCCFICCLFLAVIYIYIYIDTSLYIYNNNTHTYIYIYIYIYKILKARSASP